MTPAPPQPAWLRASIPLPADDWRRALRDEIAHFARAMADSGAVAQWHYRLGYAGGRCCELYAAAQPADLHEVLLPGLRARFAAESGPLPSTGPLLTTLDFSVERLEHAPSSASFHGASSGLALARMGLRGVPVAACRDDLLRGVYAARVGGTVLAEAAREGYRAWLHGYLAGRYGIEQAADRRAHELEITAFLRERPHSATTSAPVAREDRAWLGANRAVFAEAPEAWPQLACEHVSRCGIDGIEAGRVWVEVHAELAGAANDPAPIASPAPGR